MSDSKPRVHGLGGIFFKSRDPATLSAWYGKHLGLDVQAGWGGATFNWKRADTGEDAVTLWSPFKEDTTYFHPSDKPYMLNFRVDDLDATLTALREEGCEVLERREEGEYGKFGYVVDPEGGVVELWEPPRKDASAS